MLRKIKTFQASNGLGNSSTKNERKFNTKYVSIYRSTKELVEWFYRKTEYWRALWVLPVFIIGIPVETRQGTPNNYNSNWLDSTIIYQPNNSEIPLPVPISLNSTSTNNSKLLSGEGRNQSSTSNPTLIHNLPSPSTLNLSLLSSLLSTVELVDTEKLSTVSQISNANAKLKIALHESRPDFNDRRSLQDCHNIQSQPYSMEKQ